jgi:hypothetical protein
MQRSIERDTLAEERDLLAEERTAAVHKSERLQRQVDRGVSQLLEVRSQHAAELSRRDEAAPARGGLQIQSLSEISNFLNAVPRQQVLLPAAPAAPAAPAPLPQAAPAAPLAFDFATLDKFKDFFHKR